MDSDVFSLAWPCILSEISTPLLGVVDTLVAGHLADNDALAGVVLGVAVLSPLLLAFNFLRMATGGATAQAYGAGRREEVLAIFVRAACLGALIGCALLALAEPVTQAGFHLIPPPSAAVQLEATQYIRGRILGAPAALANFAVRAWLNGVQHPRAMLVHNVSLNVSNACLCVFLGWHLGLGAAGVGLATALANYIALALGVALVWKIYPKLQLEQSKECGERPKCLLGPGGWLVRVFLDRQGIKRLLAVQGNVFLRSLCLLALTTRFNALSAGMGKVALSANSLLNQLQMLLSYGCDGFANAAEALVGEAHGKGDMEGIRRVLGSVARWSLAVIATYTLAYTLCGEDLLEGFSWHKDVVAYALRYLPWLCAAPVFSVPAYVLDGVFVGAGRVGDMRAANCWALCAFLGLSTAVPSSNDALWASYIAHLVVRAGVLLWRCPGGVWDAPKRAGGIGAPLLA